VGVTVEVAAFVGVLVSVGMEVTVSVGVIVPATLGMVVSYSAGETQPSKDRARVRIKRIF
jgi:hypothetical protein